MPDIPVQPQPVTPPKDERPTWKRLHDAAHEERLLTQYRQDRFLEESELARKMFAAPTIKEGAEYRKRLFALMRSRPPTRDEQELEAASKEAARWAYHYPQMRPEALTKRIEGMMPNVLPEQKRAVARRVLESYKPQDKELWQLASDISRGEIPPYKQLYERVPESKWPLLGDYIARNVLGQERRTTGEKVEQALGRATVAMPRELRRFFAEYAPGVIDPKRALIKQRLRKFVGKGFRPRGVRGLPEIGPEIPAGASKRDIEIYEGLKGELERYDKRHRDVAKLQSYVERALEAGDPIVPKGLIEEALVGAAAMVPKMGVGIAASAIHPAAGVAWWGQSETMETLEAMEDAGIDENTARAIAPLAGLLSGSLEFVQVGRLKGATGKSLARALGGRLTDKVKRAGLRKTAMELGKRIPRGVANFIKEVGVQSGQEGLQALTRLAGKATAAEIDPQNIKIDWDKEIDQVIDEVVQGVKTFPVLLLPGTAFQAAGTGRELVAGLMKKDARAVETAKKLAQTVAAEGTPKEQQYAGKLITQLEEGKEVEEGLANRVLTRAVEMAEEKAAVEAPETEPAAAPKPAPKPEPVEAAAAEGPVEIETDQAAEGGAGAAVKVGATEGGTAVTLNDAASMALDDIESLDDQVAYIEALRAHMDRASIDEILETFEARAPRKAAPLLERLGKTPGQFGARNRIVTTEEAEAIKADLRKRLGATEPGAMFKPLQSVPQLAKLGLYYFEGGVRTFAEWSRTMVKELHLPKNKETVKALKQAWRRISAGRAKILGRERAIKKVARSFGGERQVRDFIEDQLLLWEKGEPSDVTPGKFVRWVKARTRTAERTKAKERAELTRTAARTKAKERAELARTKAKERAELARTKAKERAELARTKAKERAELARTAGQRRGEYLGAVAKQTDDKTLMEWAREYLPEREYKMIAAVLGRIIKSRTPKQRDAVIDAINMLVEKHNRQVAVQRVRERLKEVRGSNLLEATRNLVAELLDGIAERKPTAAAIGRARARLEAARREIEQRIEAGMPEDMAFTAIPLKALQRAEKVLERAEARPLTELSAEELAALDEGIGHLLAQDRLKKQLMGRQARRKSMDAAETSAREIAARHSQKYGDIEAMSLVDRVIRKLSRVLGLWTNAETRIYMLAGKDSLPHEVLWHDRREGDSAAAAHYRGVYDDYTVALHKANIAARDMRTWSAVKTPVRKTLKDTPLGRGRSTRLTPFERIDLYLNLMDPDTRAKILGGEGIYIARYEKTFDMSAADIDAFLREGGIDRNERAVAHIFSALINGERAITPVAGVRTDGVGEALNRVWLRMFGNRKATRQNYWSRYLKRDLGFRDPNALFREEQRRLTEESGIFQPREGGEQAVAITDAAVKFDRTVSTMSAMAGRAEAVHNAMRLLTEPAFAEAVKRGFRDGTRMLEDLKRDVLDWAAPAGRELHAVERGIDKIMRLLQIKTLATSPRVIAYQMLSLPTAGLVVPAKHLASARALVPTVKETTKEIREHWPLGRARMEGSMHDVVTPGRASTRMWELMGVDKVSTRLSNLSMEAIHQADALVIDTIWRACKLWAKADGLTGEAFWREVRKRAQYAVDATQPSTDVGVLGGLQKLTRKTPVAKLIPGMLFSSQRNKLANLQVKELSDWASEGFSGRTAMRHISRLSVSSIANAAGLAVISGAWVALVTAMGGGDDDKWLNRLYRDFMRRLWGNWILAGDLANIPFNISESWRGNVPPRFAEISDNLLISNINDMIGMLQTLGPWIAESDPKQARKHRDQVVKRALRLVGMHDLNRWLRARKEREQRGSKTLPY